MTSPALLIGLGVAHLIGDALLQGEGMLRGKRLHLPILLLHGAIHGLLSAGVAFYFSLPAVPLPLSWGQSPAPVVLGLAVGVAHSAIDTRIPVVFWQSLMGQSTEENPYGMVVAMATDQALHLVSLVGIALALAPPR